MRIPLSSPDITDAEIDAVVGVLRTTALSLGPRLTELETAFAAFVGTREAVAVSSGTAGLHLAVRACGIGEGDEVVTTPLSFVASANALLYERARPVFVDIEPGSLNIDPARIEGAITPRTRAILVVHLFGRPAAMPEILAIADRHGLPVIEDACEALGATVGGKRVGALGLAGVFGFYPNKTMTMGEGGLITTDDPALAELCRSLRNHGRDAGGVAHARLGFNYRLSDIACALGLAQLRRLPEMLARREALARAYHARLSGHPDLVVPAVDLPDARTGWFAYVVRLGARYGAADRDRIVDAMLRRGIGCQRYFSPLHLHPHIREVVGDREGEFPVTEAAAARTIALPFFNRLREAEIDEVCATLVELLSAQ